MLKSTVLLLFMLNFSNIALAKTEESIKKWYQPDLTKLQYAGYTGFLSVGIGRQFLKKRLETFLIYGYVPESLGGTAINTIAVKNSYIFLNLRNNKSYHHLKLYGGMNLLYAYDVKESTAPKCIRNEEDGYACNSIHLLPYLGVELHKVDLGKQSELWPSSIYWEVGILDVMVINYYLNHPYLSLRDVVSFSIGLKLYVNSKN